MSNCDRSPEDPADTRTAWRCPRSGSPGTPVGRQTLKALLKGSALTRLSQCEYRFCPDAHCPVVYFGANGDHFSTEDVRVAVWQKQPFADRQMCYCFGDSEGSIRAEIEACGHSSAAGRIREHITAGRCACDIRNPRGSCCLGDVIAAIERVASDQSIGAIVSPRLAPKPESAEASEVPTGVVTETQ